MNEKVIRIDELSIQRIGKLLPQWLAFGVANDCQIEIVVRKHEEKRRLKQNALYWVLMTEISQQMPPHMDELHHPPRDWDEYFKQIFLGVESCVIMGKPQHRTKAHKDLGVHDFSDYLTQCLAWADEHEVKPDVKWREDYAETERKAA